MSEAYDYLKERVKELESDVKRKDEVLAWDADKILECTTRIVEQNSTIATLQARAEKAEQNLVDCKASRVMCGERAMRLEQELIAFKAGIPVVVGYVSDGSEAWLRKYGHATAVLMRGKKSGMFKHPIYLDPQPPSKESTQEPAP